ncbi:MAG: thermonuclease family protein, partial [Hyphomicrobium sp.]
MKPVLRNITVLMGALLLAGPALAAGDDMPAPKSAPRTKVAQQKLDHDPVRGGRVLTGAVKLLDGDKMRIGDTDIRLYGVVVPQPAGAHGTEARTALVRLMAEDNISCRVLERDRNFRLLAQCKTAKTDDVGLALLQQGWALVARSVVHGSEQADPYLAAESKAQVQKLGLWAPAEVRPVVPETKTDAATPVVPVAPPVVVGVSAAPVMAAAVPVAAIPVIAAGQDPKIVAKPADKSVPVAAMSTP